MEGVETGKGKYGEASRSKGKSRRTVYQDKCKTERRRFGNVMQQKDQKCDVFKTTKNMVKTNQDVIGEQ